MAFFHKLNVNFSVLLMKPSKQYVLLILTYETLYDLCTLVFFLSFFFLFFCQSSVVKSCSDISLDGWMVHFISSSFRLEFIPCVVQPRIVLMIFGALKYNNFLWLFCYLIFFFYFCFFSFFFLKF